MDYHACDTEHIKFVLRAQLSVTKYRGRQPRMPKQRTNPKTKYRNSRQEEKIDIRSVIAKHKIYMDYHACDTEHMKVVLRAQVIATKYHDTFASQSSKHTRHEVHHLHREKTPFCNRPSTHGYNRAITPATQNTCMK